jgi:hypothetical protein
MTSVMQGHSKVVILFLHIIQRKVAKDERRKDLCFSLLSLPLCAFALKILLTLETP